MRQHRKKNVKHSIEKVSINTTFPVDLIRSLKCLAAEREMRTSDIMTEAIQDLFKKYERLGNKKL